MNSQSPRPNALKEKNARPQGQKIDFKQEEKEKSII